MVTLISQPGADPTGRADSTAALNSAIAALGTAGGTVDCSGGTFALNGVITANNIRLVGDSCCLRAAVPPSLTPFNPALPVLQIGNDTGTVYSTVLERLTISAYGPGGQGSKGIAITGGAYDSTYLELAVRSFTGTSVGLTGGINQPVAYQYFNRLLLQPDPATNDAALATTYGTTTYCTAVFIRGLSLHGSAWTAGQGWAIKNDGCNIFLADSWIACNNLHGIFLTRTGSIASNPWINGSSVKVDSNSSSDVLVQTDIQPTAGGSPIDWPASAVVRGSFYVDGYFKTGYGVLHPCSGHLIPYQSQMYDPLLYGTIGTGT